MLLVLTPGKPPPYCDMVVGIAHRAAIQEKGTFVSLSITDLLLEGWKIAHPCFLKSDLVKIPKKSINI